MGVPLTVTICLPGPSATVLGVPPRVALIREPAEEGTEVPAKASYRVALGRTRSVPKASAMLISNRGVPGLAGDGITLTAIIVVTQLRVLTPVLTPAGHPVDVVDRWATAVEPAILTNVPLSIECYEV